MNIKDMPKIEQPREKLLRYGIERLSIQELVAIILGTGNKNENALQMAERIVTFLNQVNLPTISVDQIMNSLKIGKSKACSLVACLEMGRRILNGKEHQLLLSPKDAWSQLYDIREQRREHFVVFYLDIRNQIIKKDIISIGTLTTSIVHPREVFEKAIKDGAAQIILSHNHPSQIIDPSEEDIRLTKRLAACGDILGIEIIDHIIVSKHHYFSFKEHNLI